MFRIFNTIPNLGCFFFNGINYSIYTPLGTQKPSFFRWLLTHIIPYFGVLKPFVFSRVPLGSVLGIHLRWSTPWSAIRPWRRVPPSAWWILGWTLKATFKGMPCFVSFPGFFSMNIWYDMIWSLVEDWKPSFCFFELKEKNSGLKLTQCKFLNKFLKFECYNIQLQINKKWSVCI